MAASPLDLLRAVVGPAKPPRPAATVVLLRDGPGGVEVLLTRRSGGAGFMAGATVFPGGKVDADDAALGPAPAAAAEVAAAHARYPDAPSVAAAAFFGAAVRELCEEVGIVLARRREDGMPIAAAAARQVAAAVAARRQGPRVPASAFAEALEAAGAIADLAGVAPFAWWLTPSVEPVRFDTLFFAAALPAGQVAVVDGVEGVHAAFISPAAALTDHRVGGAIALPPPTLHTLERLADLQAAGRASDADAAVRALAGRGVGARLLPHFVAITRQGPTLALPDDPLHPEAQADDAKRRNRFVLRGGRFDRVRRAARL